MSDAASAILSLAGISVSGFSADEIDDALAGGVTPREALPPVVLPPGRREAPELPGPTLREAAVNVVGWPGAQR